MTFSDGASHRAGQDDGKDEGMTTNSEQDMLALVDRMTPDAKRWWVEALRSDRFRQGRNALATITEDGVYHCCLGVLCEVAIEHGVDVHRVQRHYSNTYNYAGNSVMPPPEVLEWAFGTANVLLRVPVMEAREEDATAVEVLRWRELTALNDDLGWTFEEIAQVIEDTL